MVSNRNPNTKGKRVGLINAITVTYGYVEHVRFPFHFFFLLYLVFCYLLTTLVFVISFICRPLLPYLLPHTNFQSKNTYSDFCFFNSLVIEFVLISFFLDSLFMESLSHPMLVCPTPPPYNFCLFSDHHLHRCDFFSVYFVSHIHINVIQNKKISILKI